MPNVARALMHNLFGFISFKAKVHTQQAMLTKRDSPKVIFAGYYTRDCAGIKKKIWEYPISIPSQYHDTNRIIKLLLPS